MNILRLEKRGCDFWKGDHSMDFSDLGNYRLCTTGYTITGKDGRNYLLEFTSGDHRRTRYNHKITGAPLKHPKTEIILHGGLFVNTEFQKDEPNPWGYIWKTSWRNSAIEKELFEKHLPYTAAGVLEAVNYISADHYDGIEII